MAGPHHTGDYARRAQQVRDAANANPNTTCWRCGKTLAEHPPHRNGKPARWTAGHTVDGDRLAPLLPEASTCNYRAGGQVGAQRMRRTEMAARIRTTRRW